MPIQNLAGSVMSGAELEDILLLLLFSSAVGFAAGDLARRVRSKGDGKGDAE